jgi:hypothetical protein
MIEGRGVYREEERVEGKRRGRARAGRTRATTVANVAVTSRRVGERGEECR